MITMILYLLEVINNERIAMLQMRKDWIEELARIRQEELLGTMEQAREMNINYVTYRKLLDPSVPPVSMSVLRKVRDYIASKQDEE